MKPSPYASIENGLLTMRHVKNFICRTLELHAMLDDDHGMELLVARKIISLDLSVQQVFEQVWIPYQQQQGAIPMDGAAATSTVPPMRIIYRLAGLDGEATEEVVEEVRQIFCCISFSFWI